MGSKKEEYDEYKDINNYCSFCGRMFKFGHLECVECDSWFCDRCDDSRNGELWDDKLCPKCIEEKEEKGEIKSIEQLECKESELLEGEKNNDRERS